MQNIGLFCRTLLKKRPMFLWSLPIVATSSSECFDATVAATIGVWAWGREGQDLFQLDCLSRNKLCVYEYLHLIVGSLRRHLFFLPEIAFRSWYNRDVLQCVRVTCQPLPYIDQTKNNQSTRHCAYARMHMRMHTLIPTTQLLGQECNTDWYAYTLIRLHLEHHNWPSSWVAKPELA